VIEREIWATAALLIMRFGSGADVEAAMRAATFAASGDYARAAIWKRVKSSVETLNDLSPPDRVH
jgi:hypothetical protein